MVGYTARPELVNFTYDPDTLTLTATLRSWRRGRCVRQRQVDLPSAAFPLRKYDCRRHSLDGEINLPEPILQLIDGP